MSQKKQTESNHSFKAEEWRWPRVEPPLIKLSKFSLQSDHRQSDRSPTVDPTSTLQRTKTEKTCGRTNVQPRFFFFGRLLLYHLTLYLQSEFLSGR